jgi:Tfp pilus assembly protein PilF
MLLRKVAPRDAVDAYLAVDFVQKRNIGRIFEICMDRQRRRDRIAGIGVRQFIVSNMGSDVLFFSAGHPCERLLHLLARPVLDELVGPSMASRAIAGQYQGFPSWRVAPIHPSVGKFYSLTYVSADSRYLVYDEGYFNFEEYALRYMRGEHVKELSEALRNYHSLDGQELLALAYEASRKAPTSPLAYRLSSQALRRKGRPDIAADAAVRSLSLEPENPHNICEFVSAIKELGDLAKAESWARIGISRFPRESMVYFSLCEVLLASGNHAAVAAYADAALALHPGNASNLVRAAHYRLSAGDIRGAEDLSATLQRLKPDSTEVSSLLAAILARKQDDRAAVD